MSALAKNYRLPLALPKGPVSEHTIKRHGGTPRLVDLNAKMVAVFEEAPTLTSCAFCGWEFDGTAAQGRQEALRHREREHPEVLLLKSKRRRRRAPTPPRKVS